MNIAKTLGMGALACALAVGTNLKADSPGDTFMTTLMYYQMTPHYIMVGNKTPNFITLTFHSHSGYSPYSILGVEPNTYDIQYTIVVPDAHTAPLMPLMFMGVLDSVDISSGASTTKTTIKAAQLVNSMGVYFNTYIFNQNTDNSWGFVGNAIPVN